MTQATEGRIEVVEADITTLEVSAVVTAANSGLHGGGGVDGAVHAAAGPELLAACRAVGGCPTGQARLTPGFRLKARWVIHAVGPVWRGGAAGEDALLAACYDAALAIARAERMESVAFPAISTGVYGFPPRRAAPIAVTAVRAALAADAFPRKVILCCFGAASAALHREALAEALP